MRTIVVKVRADPAPVVERVVTLPAYGAHERDVSDDGDRVREMAWVVGEDLYRHYVEVSSWRGEVDTVELEISRIDPGRVGSGRDFGLGAGAGTAARYRCLLAKARAFLARFPEGD